MGMLEYLFRYLKSHASVNISVDGLKIKKKRRKVFGPELALYDMYLSISYISIQKEQAIKNLVLGCDFLS